MFLLSALFIVCVTYTLSAIVAETMLVSSEERALSSIVRAGFGFVISLVFFSAAWLMMPAKDALVLGVSLLFMQGYVHSSGMHSEWLPVLRAKLVSHARSLMGVLICALLFFSPLLFSGNFGPFTEGGGDVSIYADTAKYLYDRNLTEYGFSSTGFADYFANLKDALGFDQYDRYAQTEYSLLNPPQAESASYRILLARVMAPFFYAPYAMFGYLAGETNYAVFYGLLALMYGFILGSIWSFFRPFGLPIAVVSVGLVASSHGLASVFYNVYAAQSFSLAISALILAALPVIRPFSKAGFRTYGFALAFILGCYTHYLAVVGPLVFAAIFLRRRNSIPVLANALGKSIHKKLIAIVLLSVFIASMVLMVIGSKESATMLLGLINGAFMKNNNLYMGDAAQFLSLRWNDFALGILSQQHFLPYMAEYPWVMKVAAVAVVAGAAVLLLGLTVIGRSVLPATPSVSPYRNQLIVYCATITICLMNLAVVGASLYTQAKGAQNLLVYLYAAMVLPLAIAYRSLPEGRGNRALITTLGLTLVTFLALMLILRLEQAVRIGFGEDRSGVTEATFFSEARRIRTLDNDSFVLVEPRNSADLYTTIQPFFGARMAPVKHLSLQKIEYPTTPPTEASRVTLTVMIPDLIEPGDIPHLWYLQSHRQPRTWSPRGYEYFWRAERFTDIRLPRVFYSGNDFELDFGKRPLGRDAAEQGLFSYLRFGAAMLYVPPGSAGIVTARMEPRDIANHADMVKEVEQLIASGKIAPDSVVKDDGTVLTLTLKILPQKQSRLVTLARYSGEQWLNVDLHAIKNAD